MIFQIYYIGLSHLTKDTIESALIELVSEKVLQIDGDTLFQKRMKKRW